MELSLIAQDITRYGMDIYGEYRLPELIRRITAETEIPWIRLLYCYPDKITDELIAEIRDNDRVLKYIDLPVQHISDPVLRRMNRHGDCDDKESNRLRREIPGIVIRTTFIVGFPGETEEDFATLCEFVKETGFVRAGVFKYSREEDTPAYDFEDQIEEQVKQDRQDMLMRELLVANEAFNRSLVGKTLTVLCEDFDPVSNSYFGRSPSEAPEIDGKIFFTSSEKILPGSFARVEITGVLDYDLVGVAH